MPTDTATRLWQARSASINMRDGITEGPAVILFDAPIRVTRDEAINQVRHAIRGNAETYSLRVTRDDPLHLEFDVHGTEDGHPFAETVTLYALDDNPPATN